MVQPFGEQLSTVSDTNAMCRSMDTSSSPSGSTVLDVALARCRFGTTSGVSGLET